MEEARNIFYYSRPDHTSYGWRTPVLRKYYEYIDLLTPEQRRLFTEPHALQRAIDVLMPDVPITPEGFFSSGASPDEIIDAIGVILDAGEAHPDVLLGVYDAFATVGMSSLFDYKLDMCWRIMGSSMEPDLTFRKSFQRWHLKHYEYPATSNRLERVSGACKRTFKNRRGNTQKIEKFRDALEKVMQPLGPKAAHFT